MNPEFTFLVLVVAATLIICSTIDSLISRKVYYFVRRIQRLEYEIKKRDSANDQ